MSPTTNVEDYRWPEIGEASGSNSQAPTSRRDWTNAQVASSSASSPTFSSVSRRALHQIPHGQASSRAADLDIPSILSVLSPGEAAYDVDYRDTNNIAPNSSGGYPGVEARSGIVLENEKDRAMSGKDGLIDKEGRADEVDGSESLDGGDDSDEEERDQLAALPHDVTIDVELDRVIVNDFLDRDPDDFSPTIVPGPSNYDLSLRRTGTIDSTQSTWSRASTVSTIRSTLRRSLLRRSFTSTSIFSLSDNLRYASHTMFPLEGWCEFVRDHPSLQSAEIVKVHRYRQKGLIPHRFLVLQIHRKNKSNDIYLRLDRRPVPGAGFIIRLGVTPANDCALLAADVERAARGNTPVNVGIVREASLTLGTRHAQPTLHHLELLLTSINLKMTKYQLTKENCWFFCGAVLAMLHATFGGHFNFGKLKHALLPTVSELRAPTYAQVLAPPLLHVISTPSSVRSIDVSPDGKHIVSGHYDNHVRMWDVQTGAAVGKPFEGHTDMVLSVAFSPNGEWIISGSVDNTIQVWDAKTQTAIGKPLRGYSSNVWSVAFSPDGERIVSGSNDSTVRLWDRATGTAIGEPLTGHTGRVWSVACSPNGQMIASGSADNTIRLWSATTGTAIRKPLIGHTDWVRSVAFSPNGQHIASCSDDKTIRIWDTATGAQIGEPINGHTDWVMSVVYSPDGRYIALASYGGNILFWDAMTGYSISAQLNAHSEGVISIAFFPDGRIASCGTWELDSDSTIRIWEVPI